ncbi:MAG: aminopeptidase P family N-terminal domain-containing protein, partial [Candidatus Binatia bacterium]
MQDNNLVPLPSIEERDRRYKNVRASMARAGFDVLLLPANHSRWEQMMADSRYLSGIGGFATEVFTVFPLNGEVAAFVFNRAGWWKRAQNWVRDVRDGRNCWAQNAIEKLREMGFSKGKIGISGLSGLVRAPEGIVPYTTVRAIQDAFPHAEIVNATELMQEARAIKSAEEISFLQRSMEIIEEMIHCMKETARPGVTEKELYANMTHVM